MKRKSTFEKATGKLFLYGEKITKTCIKPENYKDVT